jgi:hypothetical protein
MRLDALERLMAARGRIDVLFTGSSVVRTDIHPEVFDDTFGPAGPGLVSFNAGMDGIWPLGVELYTRHLWLDAAQPRLVIQGIRFPELRVAEPAKHETQIWTGTMEAGWAEDGGVFGTLDSIVTSRLHLLQYRGVMATALGRYVEGAPGQRLADPSIRGYAPRPLPTSSVEEMEPDLPNDGTCERACDAAFAAIRRTRDAVRMAGAEYMLVNVPEHGSRWRGADGVERYDRYVRTMRAFATAENIPFLDVTGGDPFRFDGHESFGDLSHMTRAGSVRFTVSLASEVKHALSARQDPLAVTSVESRHDR